MKKLVILGFLLCLETQAKEIILGDNTYDVEAALNPQTVICLKGDYSATSFKIAIPEIDNFTELDHTSPGAPGPCINAGPCKTKENPFFGATTDDRMPLFHDPARPTEKVKIRVIRKEIQQIKGPQCLRIYEEDLSSTIRGTTFTHHASSVLGAVPAKDCQE